MLAKIMELIKIRRRKMGPEGPVIDPSDQAKLAAAKKRAERLEDVVIAYTGAELSANTGRDIQ